MLSEKKIPGINVMLNKDVVDFYSNIAQGGAALVSVLAIVPSVIYFFINQREQLKNQREQLDLARDGNHRYVIERYRDFLNVCLRYPEISLESGSPKMDLDEYSRRRRDIAFDILTSTFERAFITYVIHKERSDENQWKGWDEYIHDYCIRIDYLEWVKRVLFSSESVHFSNDNGITSMEGKTQYDTRFEKYLYSKLKDGFSKLEKQDLLNEVDSNTAII